MAIRYLPSSMPGMSAFVTRVWLAVASLANERDDATPIGPPGVTQLGQVIIGEDIPGVGGARASMIVPGRLVSPRAGS